MKTSNTLATCENTLNDRRKIKKEPAISGPPVGYIFVVEKKKLYIFLHIKKNTKGKMTFLESLISV